MYTLLAKGEQREIFGLPAYGVLPWAALRRSEEESLNFSCFMPGWDNEARKPDRGRTFAYTSPNEYGRWLVAECGKTVRDHKPDRLVFDNVWNEWSEGAHLEPDRRYGYLNATADVSQKYKDNKGPGLGRLSGFAAWDRLPHYRATEKT
jgi:hypothetical protein